MQFLCLRTNGTGLGGRAQRPYFCSSLCSLEMGARAKYIAVGVGWLPIVAPPCS